MTGTFLEIAKSVVSAGGSGQMRWARGMTRDQ